jgi:septal ring factor EnvC (AmiA/AmiB activator)
MTALRTPWAAMPNSATSLEYPLMEAIVRSMECLQALAWYEEREREHVGRLRKDLQSVRNAEERRKKRQQATLEERRRKRRRMRVKNPNRKEIAKGCECEYIPPEHRGVDMCNKCAHLNSFDRNKAFD